MRWKSHAHIAKSVPDLPCLDTGTWELNSTGTEQRHFRSDLDWWDSNFRGKQFTTTRRTKSQECWMLLHSAPRPVHHFQPLACCLTVESPYRKQAGMIAITFFMLQPTTSSMNPTRQRMQGIRAQPSDSTAQRRYHPRGKSQALGSLTEYRFHA